VSKKRAIQHHPIVGTFSKALREARKKAGLSQQDLATKAVVNIGSLGKLERGDTAPGLDMVARLADSLGITVEELVAGHEPLGEILGLATSELQRKVDRLISRGDLAAVQSLTVVIGLMDASLARNLKS